MKSGLQIARKVVRNLVGESWYATLRYYRAHFVEKDAGYCKEYYEYIEDCNEHCYPLLARVLVNEFHPKTLIDIGCGGGGIALAFQEAGCSTVHCF